MPNPEEEEDEAIVGLVAYRLGKVEKALDEDRRQSVLRDEKILSKLEEMGKIGQKVEQNTWRIGSLESSRTNIYRFVSAIAIATILLIIEIGFNVIGGK